MRCVPFAVCFYRRQTRYAGLISADLEERAATVQQARSDRFKPSLTPEIAPHLHAASFVQDTIAVSCGRPSAAMGAKLMIKTVLLSTHCACFPLVLSFRDVTDDAH